MQNISPLFQESPLLAGRVARHLQHPCLVRMSRDPGQTDTAVLQVNEEQDVVRHQAAPSEDLDREEIEAGQHGQMRLNEFLPRRVLAPLRCRRDAMTLQDVPYSLIRGLASAPTIRS